VVPIAAAATSASGPSFALSHGNASAPQSHPLQSRPPKRHTARGCHRSARIDAQLRHQPTRGSAVHPRADVGRERRGSDHRVGAMAKRAPRGDNCIRRDCVTHLSPANGFPVPDFHAPGSNATHAYRGAIRGERTHNLPLNAQCASCD
jgi:hypothetical protein